MATVTENALAPNVLGFAQTATGKKVLLSIGIAAVLAMMAATWMWSQKPEYRVLFSNFSDRDGGAIVASLQQMNIPYKFAEGGGAILVPAEQVYDARLKLASQGLPKGGNVGFELMENQKLGISQFLEQVNFQRALEGELARSIQSVAAVQSARVHLALPKESVFVRDQQKPTASVLLNLNPGRSLDPQQVSAIVHLVASSVPELSAKNVTIVDQSGNLLSNPDKTNAVNGLDPSQLKYVNELQQSIVKRIESIITPIVGQNNVRAEATADVDFSRVEQAAETYKPNQTPDSSTVRSQQTSESSSTNGGNSPSGVPGALSNQPQPNASAPINGTPANGTPGAQGAGNANSASNANNNTSTQKDTTVNYEVDKTVRYVQQPMVGLRRLSVAVVVNYKQELDKKGKAINRPLTEAEKTQITDLVKEAMGFNKDRGDSLNVVNSPFALPEREKIEDLPLWKQPEMIQMGKDGGKYLLVILVMLYLFFKVLKPMLAKLTGTDVKAEEKDGEEDEESDDGAVVALSNEPQRMLAGPRPYEENLDAARQLAKDDPKVVANIVKSWMGSNE